jgi:thioredoxin reductase (NADPH)
MLTLYGRPECHLCDEMLAELEPLLHRAVRVEVVDISDDDDLEARYGLRIPVLCAGETELCCYRLDAGRVRRWLACAE